MRRGLAVWCVCALVALTPGCALLHRQRKPVPRAEAVVPVEVRQPLQRLGMVALVNEEERFVLIDSGALPTPSTGALLASYSGPTLSAQLKASAVRRRPFVVADVLEGAPRVGDDIFEVKPATAVRKAAR